jgi:hypothetical protein
MVSTVVSKIGVDFKTAKDHPSGWILPLEINKMGIVERDGVILRLREKGFAAFDKSTKTDVFA